MSAIRLDRHGRLRRDRPHRRRDDTVLHLEAERARGGLQHLLRRALVEELLDPVLNDTDELVRRLGLQLDGGLSERGVGEEAHARRRRDRGVDGYRVQPRCEHEQRHRICRRSICTRRRDLVAVDFEAVDGEVVGAEHGECDGGERRLRESPVRGDARPAVLLDLERRRSGVAAGDVLDRHRGDAVVRLLADDLDVAERCESGLSQHRLGCCWVDARTLEDLPVDRDPRDVQRIGGVAGGEQVDVARDESRWAVELLVQHQGAGAEGGEQQHSDHGESGEIEPQSTARGRRRGLIHGAKSRRTGL